MRTARPSLVGLSKGIGSNRHSQAVFNFSRARRSLVRLLDVENTMVVGGAMAEFVHFYNGFISRSNGPGVPVIARQDRWDALPLRRSVGAGTFFLFFLLFRLLTGVEAT